MFASATAGGMILFKTLVDTYFLHKNLRIAAAKAAGKEVTDIELLHAAFFDGRVPMDKIKKYNTLLQTESRQITLKDLYKSYTDKYDIDILCHDMMLDPEWEESAKGVLEFMNSNK